MPTAGDDAADDDDDCVSGYWRHQFTNQYVVTRCQGTYSVTIMHKQKGKKRGTDETLVGITRRDTNGNYTWGRTHKLRIYDGTLVWDALPGKKTTWTRRRRRPPRVQFSADEISLGVPMSELRDRLAACLVSSWPTVSLCDIVTQPTTS